jgi:N,N'-diacetyllegionaminate synthase
MASPSPSPASRPPVEERGTLVLGRHRLGAGLPCFVIAEAGVNHNGDVGLAHRLVETSAAAGADAVKFQTFRPERLVADAAGAAPYQRRRGASTQREMLQALALDDGAWRELAAHARERNLVFLSTAFDLRSLDVLLDLGVEALKVPSGEIDNLPFVRELARRELPLLMSTGMATQQEVAAAVAAAAGASGLALLHCVTAYPAPVEESNLRAIVTMREAFGLTVGWSDHTEGSVTAVAAVALGASLLEKHVTIDRTLPGPDHAASSSPEELAAYVAAVRAAETSLGDGVKRPAPAERENVRHARRSYHALRDLRAGERLGEEDVALLRPADGLPPGTVVVGRRVARPVAAGSALVEQDLE